jgi:hypothetical protein
MKFHLLILVTALEIENGIILLDNETKINKTLVYFRQLEVDPKLDKENQNKILKNKSYFDKDITETIELQEKVRKSFELSPDNIINYKVKKKKKQQQTLYIILSL